MSSSSSSSSDSWTADFIPYWQVVAAATAGGLVGSTISLRAPKPLVAAGGAVLGVLTGMTALTISHLRRDEPKSDRRSDVP
jgi:hypothetical protein